MRFHYHLEMMRSPRQMWRPVEEGKERNRRPRRLEESGSGGGQRGRGGRCLAMSSHGVGAASPRCLAMSSYGWALMDDGQREGMRLGKKEEKE
jgi:hypothetical protein